MSDVIVVVVIVLLLAVAALGGAAEAAVIRTSRVRAHHIAQERNTKSAETLVRIVEDPAPFLNVIVLIMLAAHVTGTALATGFAIDSFGGAGQAAAAAIMTFLLFVFAEAVPKTFVAQRTEGTALAIARPTSLLEKVLRPLGRLLIWVANVAMILLPGRGFPKGPFVTEDEIRHMVDVAEEEEEIEEEERELIHSVFEFGDTVVREVMVPRPDMITVRSDAGLDEALATVVRGGFSRIPIYEGDTDNIVGVLYAKDLLKRLHETGEGAIVKALARKPLFVPEQKKVAELLREMQKERVHMEIGRAHV